MCFVISPIGEEDSEIRRHADNVLHCIIRPALQECDVYAFRADEMEKPGQITPQMIKAIVDSELCVVLLTGHNPNVFYELAIAQAAKRPIVLLIQKGEQIPFDIKDYRTVYYDLEPRNIFDRKWLNQVKSQVEHVLRQGYEPPSLLGDRTLFREGDHNSYWISNASKEYGEPPKFTSLMKEATQFCDIMGIALKYMYEQANREALLELLRHGCKVRMLFMDAENPALISMINTDLASEDLEGVKSVTTKMSTFFEDLAQSEDLLEVRRIRKGMPHFQLVSTDKTTLCLQYMYGRGTSDSPLLLFPSGSSLHNAYHHEFEVLWNSNQPFSREAEIFN